MVDDDGTFTSGTALDEAFIDLLLDEVDTQVHSATNPTVLPKTITDEVIAARDGEANLLAKLNALDTTDYLTGVTDLGATWVISQQSLRIKHVNVAHGMTTIVPTDVWFQASELNAGFGGALIRGLSEGNNLALSLFGSIGSVAPTNAAVEISGSKKSGTTHIDLAATERVLKIRNFATTILTVFGNGDTLFAGEVQVGDADFKLDYVSATETRAQFAATDYIAYLRSSNRYSFCVGDASVATIETGRVGLANGTEAAPAIGPIATPDVGLYFTSSSIALGVTGEEVIKFSSNGGTIAYWEMIEHSDAAAPAANAVRVYCRDSGAGKTQIVARFATGAVVPMASEP